MTVDAVTPSLTGYAAVDGVIIFLSDIYTTPEEIRKLAVPAKETYGIAELLYDRWSTHESVIQALMSVQPTRTAHVPVFQAAIRKMTELMK